MQNQPLHDNRKSFPWMKLVLLTAGVYNLLWGASVVLFPFFPFEWAGLELPNYPQIWQALGMVVGVYGVGYCISAFDPFRHWPIIFVGLLGKVLGPIGMLWSLRQGTLPPTAAWLCAGNDVIWWLPFGLILYQAYQASRPRHDSRSDEEKVSS